MKKDLLTIRDLTAEEVRQLLARSAELKADLRTGNMRPVLSGKVLGLIFAKPSTRTRVSFETAMYRLGGQCIFMSGRDTQISRKEPVADTARVLSRYVDCLAIRTFEHTEVEELARFSSIPVINALTDRFHPCQILSDLFTIQERRGSLQGLHVGWIGDGNNVANSWINAAALLGFDLTLACPQGYDPAPEVLSLAARSNAGGRITLTRDPRSAAKNASVLYTDVWSSMGQEKESEERRAAFKGFTIDSTLVACAPPDVIVLHCLPAHRGEEITDEVIEGLNSAVFDQAENRLHLQMALLEWLLCNRDC